VSTLKNTVRVILFLAVLSGLLFFFKDQLQSGIFGFLSVLITLSVIFIGFVIFFENRHPTQTITWLVVLGSFPLIGFIFYLLFGRNYRKERMFRKKYFLDKQAFLTVEGEDDPRSQEKLSLMGEHQGKLFKLAQKSHFI